MHINYSQKNKYLNEKNIKYNTSLRYWYSMSGIVICGLGYSNVKLFILHVQDVG